MKKFFALIVFFALASPVLATVGGCNPAKKFTVVEASAPALEGLTAVRGRAVVRNDSARKLVIESGRLTLSYRGRELGRGRLSQPVTLAARTTTDARYDLALEGFSLSSALTVASRAASNPDELTVDGEIWVRWGGWRKKIVVKSLPVTQLLEIMPIFAV